MHALATSSATLAAAPARARRASRVVKCAAARVDAKTETKSRRCARAFSTSPSRARPRARRPRVLSSQRVLVRGGHVHSLIHSTISDAADASPSSRRRAFLGVAFGALTSGALSTAAAANAKSLEEAAKEKEDRKAALRAAAAASAASGRGESAFAASEYSLSEESKTPNFHTRQEEGARRSGGA